MPDMVDSPDGSLLLKYILRLADSTKMGSHLKAVSLVTLYCTSLDRSIDRFWLLHWFWGCLEWTVGWIIDPLDLFIRWQHLFRAGPLLPEKRTANLNLHVSVGTAWPLAPRIPGQQNETNYEPHSAGWGKNYQMGVSDNTFEGLYDRGSPSCCWGWNQVASRWVLRWPQVYNIASFFETTPRLAFRRFLVEEPRLSETAQRRCAATSITERVALEELHASPERSLQQKSNWHLGERSHGPTKIIITVIFRNKTLRVSTVNRTEYC